MVVRLVRRQRKVHSHGPSLTEYPRVPSGVRWRQTGHLDCLRSRETLM
ncbi:hypothetical protein [Saccharopolyspora thermophila]|nr:hypothetical protein [Saccharopolyspora subtropica]